ncbi:30S ribosomal protein S9 [Photobacterium sp. SKA34]|nr:30S ribosomal protein S9 [Photobacterium sp. SKA34]
MKGQSRRLIANLLINKKKPNPKVELSVHSSQINSGSEN